VARWTCPRCEREFGKPRQAHDCIPGCTVDETFAPWPDWQREIYELVIGHLVTLGDVHEDAVRVGVFLKHESKLAEVRPMARALSLNLYLPRRVDDRRVVRTITLRPERVVHVIRLTDPRQVDARVRELLTEAWVSAG
jgi:hypothetical protein